MELAEDTLIPTRERFDTPECGCAKDDAHIGTNLDFGTLIRCAHFDGKRIMWWSRASLTLDPNGYAHICFERQQGIVEDWDSVISEEAEKFFLDYQKRHLFNESN